MSDTQFIKLPGGTRIAHRFVEGSGPALVFLPGYMSDMEGGKATAVFERARESGRACLLLDYSGCGASSGDFAEGTLSLWRDEVLALIQAKLGRRPVVLIGSSMGGWLMLLIGLALGEQVAGCVGIAAAPDFTDWGYDEGQKTRLEAGETIFEDSDYGYDPMPTHAKFWADGQANRLLDSPIPLTCPVRLIHGQRDADVPWETSLRLANALTSEDVCLTLVKQGDHRLSRDEDIALLLKTIQDLG